MSDGTLDIPRQPEADETVGLDVLADQPPVAAVAAVVPEQVAPAAPTATVEEGAVDVTCPSCGTVAHIFASRRGSADFCRSCDYPLFWAVERVAPPASQVGDNGLRRLPGTAGRAALASLQCPVCTEPNKPSAQLCVRCGAVLRPVAEPEMVEPEPEAEPEPEVVVQKTPWWVWAIAASLVVATLTAIFVVIYD